MLNLMTGNTGKHDYFSSTLDTYYMSENTKHLRLSKLCLLGKISADDILHYMYCLIFPSK